MSPAEILAQSLGATHCSGGTWLACCVAHEDGTPSLAIREGRSGRVLLHCHAGCEQADVLAALAERRLWPIGHITRLPQTWRVIEGRQERHRGGRTDQALAIWRAARPAAGTLAETYLRSRTITLPISARLRFAPRLWHGPTGSHWPAMVALVTDAADTAIGVHRTYLARSRGGKAPIAPSRMMLGRCAGSAVRLAPATDHIIIAEGIETALSASDLSGLPAWASLSASGLCALELPDCVRDVVIAADRDDTGRAAALDAARRWLREGRHVRVLQPPHGFNDFNDLLALRAPGEVQA
jgi:phage/plasmid primase-like uncharacterized protein